MMIPKGGYLRRWIWKFLHWIGKIWVQGYLKIFLNLVVITALLLIKVYCTPDEKTEETFGIALLKFITDNNTVSIFSTALVGVLLVQIGRLVGTFTEEKRKTSQDHHAIIRHYNGYSLDGMPDGKQYDPDGVFMKLSKERIHKSVFTSVFPHWRYPMNPIIQAKSKEFFQYEKASEEFLNGKLYLPTIDIFINKDHDVEPRFDDHNDKGGDHNTESRVYTLPDVVSGNETSIFQAHTHSATSNSVTVRLYDVHFDIDEKTKEKHLTLDTGRTTYYDMLMTNRCMDYDFGNGMTLRNLYEYKSKVSSFKNSKLANQIGINGMIITNDGWLLLEKRSLKKSTWKGKYAQPISLSMGINKLGFYEGQDTIENSIEGSHEVISHLLRHTIRDNYGLLVKDYDELKKQRIEKEKAARAALWANTKDPIELEHLKAHEEPIKEFESSDDYKDDECYYITGSVNFLGLARDLLEGGKPNLYYAVVLGMDHNELAEHLRKLKRRKGPIPVKSETKADKEVYSSKTRFPAEKLESGYVIAKDEDITFDMNYRLSFLFKKVKKVRAAYHLWPLVWRKRGCGEALLVTMAYIQEMGGAQALVNLEAAKHPDILKTADGKKGASRVKKAEPKEK
jgi:hypothetical protein